MKGISPKNYVIFVVSIFASLLALNAIISVFAIRYNLFTWGFASLFEYQSKKLNAGPPIDLLLVGDSSLGNAVDARSWSVAEGRVVVNGALTGVYGYAGTLQMLRRAAANRGVKTALIVQAADTMIRPISHEGALFSAGNFRIFTELPLSVVIPWLLSKDIPLNLLRSTRDRTLDVRAEMEELDYLPQGNSLSAREKIRSPFNPVFDAGKTLYLREIVSFCRSHNIECIYAHGPVIDPMCRDTNGYYTAVNAKLRETGIDLISESPPCIPPEDIGDTVDHVIPSVKQKYTHIYMQILSEYRASHLSP